MQRSVLERENSERITVLGRKGAKKEGCNEEGIDEVYFCVTVDVVELG